MALGFVQPQSLVNQVGQALSRWNNFAAANDLPTTQDIGAATVRGAIDLARRAPGALATMAERNAAYVNNREAGFQAYLNRERQRVLGGPVGSGSGGGVSTFAAGGGIRSLARGSRGRTLLARSSSKRFVRAETHG